jgi:hypothetical protein
VATVSIEAATKKPLTIRSIEAFLLETVDSDSSRSNRAELVAGSIWGCGVILGSVNPTELTGKSSNRVRSASVLAMTVDIVRSGLGFMCLLF